jgi:hypothetical protein
MAEDNYNFATVYDLQFCPGILDKIIITSAIAAAIQSSVDPSSICNNMTFHPLVFMSYDVLLPTISGKLAT